jgi:NTE family protein
MTAPDTSLLALVLSGGGAYAAYGVGVMKALFGGASPATGYTPLDPDIYAGTSGGAINAAFMLAEPGSDNVTRVARLENTWVNEISDQVRNCGNGVYRFRANLFRYLELTCFTSNPLRPFLELASDAVFFARDGFRRGVNFLLSSGKLEQRLLQFFDASQFITDEPLRQGIGGLFSVEGIRRSNKVLRVIATNWSTGEARVFGNSELSDEAGYEILLGSAAIPGLFQPHLVGGDLYVDGGLVMNTPLMPAISAGASTLHVVYLDPDPKNIPLRRLQNTLDVLDRARVIDWASRMNEDIATARWINEGLEVVERLRAGGSLADLDERLFVRVAEKIAERARQGQPYRKLTIHRYHPRDDLAGPLGVLNFDRDQIAGIIERGFRDAADHDCVANGCLLPRKADPPHDARAP